MIKKSKLSISSSAFLFPEIYIKTGSILFRLPTTELNKSEIDLRDPSEKLKELQDRLNSEDLAPQEKFVILSQINSLMKVLHGEFSIQSLRSEAEIGFFYDENLNPQLALRYLERAYLLVKHVKLEDDELVNIASEIALAHLYLKKEGKFHIKKAEDVLKQFYNTSISNTLIRFKRDLSKSRIFSLKNEFDKAFQSYQEAINSLRETNKNQSSRIEGQLYLEIAKTFEKVSDSILKPKKIAKRCYMRAHETFLKIGDKESANNIDRNKLPSKYIYELEHPGEHMAEEEEQNEKTTDDETLLETPLDQDKIEFAAEGKITFEEAPKHIRIEVIKIQNQLQNLMGSKKIRIEYIPIDSTQNQENDKDIKEEKSVEDDDDDIDVQSLLDDKPLPPPSKVVVETVSSAQSFILNHDQFEVPQETKPEDVKKLVESEEVVDAIVAIDNMFLNMSSYKKEMDAQAKNEDKKETDDKPKEDPLDRFRRRRRKKNDS